MFITPVKQKKKWKKIEIVILYVETHVVVTVLIFAGTIELKKPITVHFYCSLSASVVILSANERGHKINTKWPLYICINRNYSVIFSTTHIYFYRVRKGRALSDCCLLIYGGLKRRRTS